VFSLQPLQQRGLHQLEKGYYSSVYRVIWGTSSSIKRIKLVQAFCDLSRPWYMKSYRDHFLSSSPPSKTKYHLKNITAATRRYVYDDYVSLTRWTAPLP
jgi:hypothetical protein